LFSGVVTAVIEIEISEDTLVDQKFVLKWKIQRRDLDKQQRKPSHRHTDTQSFRENFTDNLTSKT
jgi:hypothetical protein